MHIQISQQTEPEVQWKHAYHFPHLPPHCHSQIHQQKTVEGLPLFSASSISVIEAPPPCQRGEENKI